MRFGFAPPELEVGPRSERTLSGPREGSSAARERKEERISFAVWWATGVLEWWIAGGSGVRPRCVILQDGERFCVGVG